LNKWIVETTAQAVIREGYTAVDYQCDADVGCLKKRIRNNLRTGDANADYGYQPDEYEEPRPEEPTISGSIREERPQEAENATSGYGVGFCWDYRAEVPRCYLDCYTKHWRTNYK
jgi:hypothetical protein